MSKPFSKLQRDLYNLMDRSTNFQIHCVAYRMPNSKSRTPQIPRYWITVGKGKDQKIIWDFPKDSKGNQRFQMYDHIPQISNLIREYINTPKEQIKNKIFKNDKYGLTHILKQFDRRLNIKPIPADSNNLAAN